MTRGRSGARGCRYVVLMTCCAACSFQKTSRLRVWGDEPGIIYEWAICAVH